jgi:hypothetical protein
MILCSEVIWTGKLISTYCMRERGHSGEHNIVNEEPVKKERKESNADSIQISDSKA